MKVKRYVTSDLPEAVQQIRRELGADAIILNTKEVRSGGFLGMFRKKKVEVIAAVDETSRQSAARLPRLSAASAASAVATMPQQALQQEQVREEETPPMPSQAVRRLYHRNAATGGSITSPAAGHVAVADPDRTQPAAEASAPEPARSVPEPAGPAPEHARAVPEPARSAPEPASTAAAADSRHSSMSEPEMLEAASLMQELRAMKDMMQKIARQQSFRSMPESVLKWSRKLAEQGVEPVYVEQFAEEVRERLKDYDEPDDQASYEAAREVLASWLRPCVDAGIGRDTRIVHFVGPTGVGKTTTLAKLAADQSLSHQRAVGFITADTYRISAVDQLRTYADILNVPLEVVFSPSELARAYRKLSDRDLLFMDTAGRNYRNELYVSEVNSLLAPGEKTETFLVLSLTHKYADMKALVTQFAKYGIRRLLLTKADETDTYGSMVNLVKEFESPISYITNGQTVPDDIRVFDPEEWIHKLLGESAYA